MLEVEPTGQRDRMATRNGHNVLDAEKLHLTCRYRDT